MCYPISMGTPAAGQISTLDEGLNASGSRAFELEIKQGIDPSEALRSNGPAFENLISHRNNSIVFKFFVRFGKIRGEVEKV